MATLGMFVGPGHQNGILLHGIGAHASVRSAVVDDVHLTGQNVAVVLDSILEMKLEISPFGSVQGLPPGGSAGI